MSGVGIKICGITSVEAGETAANEGADAVGFVFFHKSPRNISPEDARSIGAKLPGDIAKVGVFVNATLEFLLEITRKAGLDYVQLHGDEPLSLIKEVLNRDIGVIKGLFLKKAPAFEAAGSFYVNHPKMMFLAECGTGKLPGGNAESWDFHAAENLCKEYPTLLAGGLDPVNVGKAIKEANPLGVDVSSGVEASPGVKDLNKIKIFIQAVRKVSPRSEKNPFQLR